MKRKLSILKKNADMAINKRIREIVYKKYDGHCAYCGKKIEYKDMQIDHIYSKYKYERLLPAALRAEAKGDVSEELQRQIDEMPTNIDNVSNLMPSCRACNFRKGTFTLEQFREELRKQAANEMKRFQARQSADYGLIEYNDHPIVFYFERCCETCKYFRKLNTLHGECVFLQGYFKPKDVCKNYKAY